MNDDKYGAFLIKSGLLLQQQQQQQCQKWWCQNDSEKWIHLSAAPANGGEVVVLLSS